MHNLQLSFSYQDTARTGFPEDTFVISGSYNEATDRYTTKLIDRDGNEAHMMLYMAMGDCTSHKTASIIHAKTCRYIKDKVYPSVKHRPRDGFAGQFSDLKVVRRYGDPKCNWRTDGTIIEPGIVFLVLTAQVLGIPMMFSCEGHPTHFYCVFADDQDSAFKSYLLDSGVVAFDESDENFPRKHVMRMLEEVSRDYESRNKAISLIGATCERILADRGLKLTRDIAINELGASPIAFSI